MRNRLPSIFAAVSLVVLVLLLFGWAYSYVPGVHVFSYRGDVVIAIGDKRMSWADPDSDSFAGVANVIASSRNLASDQRKVLGVEVISGPAYDGTFRIVLVPYAYFVIPAALLALVAVRAARVARRRRNEGRCPDCGYDLRASPGRCPECGRDSSFTAGAARPTTSGVSAGAGGG